MGVVIPFHRDPLPYAWQEVALTFDGNEYWGNFDKCSEVGTTVNFGVSGTLIEIKNGREERLSGATWLRKFTTIELRTGLYFVAWCDGSSEPTGCPDEDEENMVRELIRREGLEWLTAEVQRVRDNPRPPSCPVCGSWRLVSPLVDGHPCPEAFRPPPPGRFHRMGCCPCPDCEGWGWVWICVACSKRF
jgi:hypothetical protein